MSNDLVTNTAPVSHVESKPVNSTPAPATVSAAPVPQPTNAKKERHGKKSAGAFGAAQRVKV